MAKGKGKKNDKVKNGKKDGKAKKEDKKNKKKEKKNGEKKEENNVINEKKEETKEVEAKDQENKEENNETEAKNKNQPVGAASNEIEVDTNTEAGQIVQKLAESFQKEVEEVTQKNYTTWKAVSYTKQLVAGTNYFIKVDAGDKEFIHMRVYVDLQQQSNMHSFRAGLHSTVKIDYFDKTVLDPQEIMALGIDFGGTGIKGALVDLHKGTVCSERHRIPTPNPSTTEECMKVLVQLIDHFNWKGKPVGVTFPGVVINGVVLTAANVDKSWENFNLQKELSEKTGCAVVVLNDADAAGIAEMNYGAGRNAQGVTFIITIGTGIGSALFINNTLVPNTELGHMKIRGKDAEHRAADKVRREKELSWKEWAAFVDEFLSTLEFLFSPSLFIIGGGVSKKHEKYFKFFTVKSKVVPAELLNEAGIVGAAMEVKK